MQPSRREAVELSDSKRDELLQRCRQNLDAFRMQRGEEVGCLLTQKPAASGTAAATARRSAAGRNKGCSPVPRAAANAAGQAVAWQTPHQRALEMDHIVPRNQGGSDDLSNLQARMQSRCNRRRWSNTDNRKRHEMLIGLVNNLDRRPDWSPLGAHEDV